MAYRECCTHSYCYECDFELNYLTNAISFCRYKAACRFFGLPQSDYDPVIVEMFLNHHKFLLVSLPFDGSQCQKCFFCMLPLQKTKTFCSEPCQKDFKFLSYLVSQYMSPSE
jgi:hypothetical protein